MRFELVGPFKPYVRMTQRSKWVDPQAQAYLASKDALALQFQAQSGFWTPLARGVPLTVEIEIEHAGGFHNRDLDNEVKAILDAAQGVVYDDDRWIDQIRAIRTRGEAERIVVIVTPAVP